jgi:poly-gamma-glutamate synthase PgsB/CapB
MDATLLLAGAAGMLTSMGYLEAWLHRRRLDRLAIRIHVNGARGKSSVTRLIAAGLRAGGLRTCAKTTGTLPRMIFPDGSEYPVFRPGRSNVIEQRRVVRAAAEANAEALVVECMALQPMLQSLSELRLIRATHGVITNVRADHLDVMGPTTADVAKALAGTTPQGGKLFTAERRHLPVLAEAAADRRSELVALRPEDLAAITLEDLVGFPYIEHADNVALALKVCQDVGVDRQTALRGMWEATPDPGVLSAHPFGRRLPRNVFVNGFAANDPESTGHNWHLAIDRFPQLARRIAVFNCRADRPERSMQLAENCVRWQPADHYLVIGSATDVFIRRATALGLERTRISSAEKRPPEHILDTIERLADHASLVVGLGNIGGPGMAMVRHYQNQSLSN